MSYTYIEVIFMSIVKAKVFMSGRSQAVRLPKEFRIDEKEVSIKKIGNTILLYNSDNAWDEFLAAPSVTLEFGNSILEARNEVAEQERKYL